MPPEAPRVAMLAYPGAGAFDFVTVNEIFGVDHSHRFGSWYQTYTCAISPGVVELDAGPTLTVLRQNLHGSTDQALGRRGQGVTVGWADEHVIDLSGRAPEQQPPEHDRHDQKEKS